MNEIRTELYKQFPPLHPQLAGDRDADEQPVHKNRCVEAPLPVHPPPPPPAHPAAPIDFDLDGGIEVKDENEQEEEHDINWELKKWFSSDAPKLLWKDEDAAPAVNWKKDGQFPLLSPLARRFLCVMPTSAPHNEFGLGSVAFSLSMQQLLTPQQLHRQCIFGTITNLSNVCLFDLCITSLLICCFCVDV